MSEEPGSHSDVSCHGSSFPVQSSWRGPEVTLSPLEDVQKRSQISQIQQVKLWGVPHLPELRAVAQYPPEPATQ